MPTAADERPHVLLITTDHWTGRLLGCAGHPAVQTPTLDQLAKNGTRFVNAYSECPVCVPARRTLLTGLEPQAPGHGLFANQSKPMPPVPSVAQVFRDHGYQTQAVGKLHIHPQRARAGFDDVLLDEEGRGHEGCRADDYELFLADHGYAGCRFADGMSNNEYVWRPWHLPEALHVTNWAAARMCRQIVRRDPTRPAFWYLSFSAPHPPLTPLQAYLDMYRDVPVPDALCGDWIAGDVAELPPVLGSLVQAQHDRGRDVTPVQMAAIRRAFYAQCTHIDHQIRRVIGTLRQENLIANTIICFTSDHGDMLGDHRLFGKQCMYEGSAGIPMLVVGTQAQSDDGTVGHHRLDERLAGLADVMPTLLDLAGLEIPAHCTGESLVGPRRRDYLYAAWRACLPEGSGAATRMIREARWKLVYYPSGNLIQLFDIRDDPLELHDVAGLAEHAGVRAGLEARLVERLADESPAWVVDGQLVGEPPKAVERRPNRSFSGQRSDQLPTPAIGAQSW